MAISKGTIRARFELKPHARVIARAFEEAGAEFGDWRPAWRLAAAGVRAGLVRGLDSRGASIGRRWPPAKVSYATRKLRERFGAEPLVRTGWFGAAARSVLGSPAGSRITKRTLFAGLRDDLADRAAVLQFKRGYWFSDWDEGMRAAVSAAVDSYVQSVFARVRAKMAQVAA